MVLICKTSKQACRELTSKVHIVILLQPELGFARIGGVVHIVFAAKAKDASKFMVMAQVSACHMALQTSGEGERLFICTTQAPFEA